MVVFSFAAVATAVALFAHSAVAVPSPSFDSNGIYAKREASCDFPKPSKTISLDAAMSVTGTFDGDLVRYDRGEGACKGQKEGGKVAAVFVLQPGATIRNVVIGAHQSEGIHCMGPCNIYNVWFEDVCEDAITLKQTSGTTNISGGGAKNASDKVIQHNGGGTVNIESFCVINFGKLYRSCGNCKTQFKRVVNISHVIAQNGKALVGVNAGDLAKIATSTNSYKDVESICSTFQSASSGNEPKMLASNKHSSRQFSLFETLDVVVDLGVEWVGKS
ncbi:putative effector protein/Pectate lyase [Ceratobasidium theobromae]|uniref:Pectate lyase n=1 Tax=Ceratobasidium theobromae TaxID=1582974 RepID=A0A5N5QCJ8_9AGAM|nr:putative effector protein/Pectate lyase [Ceratobasidium theobromae]